MSTKTTPTNAAKTIAEHVIGSLRNADYVAIAERYAPDALLDMNVPNWRFQVQGPESIKQYFVEQTNELPNLRCTQLRELVTADAIAVESECRFDGPDGEYLWRAMDLVRIVGDEIVEHTQYCTGCWTPSDIARQASGAPMVRW
jgi:predicted SnoaL-like aldol condensation-catalyzing enzyme